MGEITTKVSTGKPRTAGSIYVANYGAMLPTDAKTPVDSKSYKSLGSVSEDGVKNAVERKMGSIKDWSGAEVLAPQEEYKDTFEFTLIDCKDPNVLKAVYGDANVTGDYETGIKVAVSPDELEYKSWVIDMVLSDGDLKRIVVPKAKITELAEITYKATDAIGYGVTLNAALDTSGKTHHEYIIKKPAV